MEKKKKQRSILIARPRNLVSLFRTDLVADCRRYNSTTSITKENAIYYGWPGWSMARRRSVIYHRNYRNWSVIRGTYCECMYRVCYVAARTCRRVSLCRDRGHEIAIKLRYADKTIVRRCSGHTPDGNYFRGGREREADGLTHAKEKSWRIRSDLKGLIAFCTTRARTHHPSEARRAIINIEPVLLCAY